MGRMRARLGAQELRQRKTADYYMNKIIVLIFCHLIGDYVLQNDFIAKSKGGNWYHLIVHCVLYCFPFFVFFGLTWELLFVFFMHMIIDASKARYHIISYAEDQIFHYIVMLIYLS